MNESTEPKEWEVKAGQGCACLIGWVVILFIAIGWWNNRPQENKKEPMKLFDPQPAQVQPQPTIPPNFGQLNYDPKETSRRIMEKLNPINRMPQQQDPLQGIPGQPEWDPLQGQGIPGQPPRPKWPGESK
jgi:hypothetical protein